MENIFRRIGITVKDHRRLVILASILLVLVGLIGATNIEMESGTKLWVSSDSQTYKDYQRFSRDFSGEVIAVMVTGNDLNQLLQPQNLAGYETIENTLGDTQAYPNIISAFGPAVVIRQGAQGNPAAFENTGALLASIADPETDQVIPAFAKVIPDKQHVLIYIVIKPELENDEIENMIDDIDLVIEQANLSPEIDAVVTGLPVMVAKSTSRFMPKLSQMLLFAVLLLLVVLALTFKVRGIFIWRWLPLFVVLVGIIYTFGLMGFLDVGLSSITMGVFPILIGLGIDYGIQIHNRYDEETSKGNPVTVSVTNSITTMGPAVAVALAAGCLGFAALLFSPAPMIQDFGLLLIIGVICAYIVALFPLGSILCMRGSKKKENRTGDRKDKPVRNEEKAGIVERGITRMAPWIIRNPFIILPIALALTMGGFLADSHIDTATDESEFFNDDLEFIQDYVTFKEVAGGTHTLNLLFESDTSVATPEVLNWMDELETHLADPESGYQNDIAAINSITQVIRQQNNSVIPQTEEGIGIILDALPEPMTRTVINPTRKASNIALTLAPMDNDHMKTVVNRIRQEIDSRGTPEGTQVSITGDAIINVKALDALTGGRQKMTFLGLGFIFTGLFVLFRFRPIRALLVTLPIVLIIGWSALMMFILEIKFTPLTATLGAMIMAAGVEYTILVISRYYEERDKGTAPVQAMTTALTRIGQAITVSAFTTMGGFAALLIATDFPILQEFGLVTMINVFFALVASIGVLPSLVVRVDSSSQKYPFLKRL